MFTPPTYEQVSEFCISNNYKTDPQLFIDYYKSVGWQVGKNPMVDWKATLRRWETKSKDEHNAKAEYKVKNKFDQGFSTREYDFAEYEEMEFNRLKKALC